MNGPFDLIVVGGGPAGAAAGIEALGRGLRVALLERRPFPRHRPGETLHPGVEPILRQLGVFAAVEALQPIRPAAVMTAWGQAGRLIPFGQDDRGPWRGFQVLRSDFDRLLLLRFTELGGKLVQPAADVSPIIGADSVRGVRSGALVLEAEATIDASGTGGFLRRMLGIGVSRCSSRLVARYGYRRGAFAATPHLTGDATGWTWIADVAPGLVHWTRLSFADFRSSLPPGEIAHLEPVGRQRAADVTWRRLDRFAGAGYFIAGDAAMSLDPAASHGVLRALMSGMMAAHGAAEVVFGRSQPESAAHTYSTWLASWFWRDTVRMRAFYRELGLDQFFCLSDVLLPRTAATANGRG